MRHENIIFLVLALFMLFVLGIIVLMIPPGVVTQAK